MAGLAMDCAAGRAFDGVIADEGDRLPGGQELEDLPGEETSQLQAGPAGLGEDPLVGGDVSGRQRAEGPQQVGDGASPGGQDGGGEQDQEAPERGPAEDWGERAEAGEGLAG
jgi:hypothetical protein